MLKNLLAGISAALLLVTLAFVVGCSSEPKPSAGASAPSGTDDWKAGLDDKTVQALSQLSDADRTAALAQKTCPVAGGPLGGMGKPIKVTIEGRDVFLCCAACEDALRENPEEYLQKLDSE